VNAIVIEVRRGRDGKLYPVRMPTPEEERGRARWLAHDLVHRGGLSLRQAQQAMREVYGVRRSLGQVHADLHRFECEWCRERGRRPRNSELRGLLGW
jgi:hypothetical protein